ncbi:hypothetical protein PF008_g15575 [Phytophthora fragariae]|uniref:C3H1-type domain-containing protein n=1 Tax=Phytophthora fragariae TaxID=53985 RepID=A0A6G0RE55_9STRA|nr:hypothetical protein PF008_g15575 [Phytophthora fragariae]
MDEFSAVLQLTREKQSKEHGFCSHGSSCRYRHIKLGREECPKMADFALQSKVVDEVNVKRRNVQPVSEFFKIAICKHWEKMVSCPQRHPQGREGGMEVRDGRDGDHHGLALHSAPPERHYQPPTGPQLPDDGKMAKYFMVQ